MKYLVVLFLSLTLISNVGAQLPNGSLAPDFNLIDINGTQHHLHSYLNQGKTVILNFSEAWCTQCWNYHQTGALQDFYTLYGPDGTDEATVVFIETDPVLGIDDLNGITAATAGDWVTGTPYGIIDDTAANNEFMPVLAPTIYGVYPDGTITLLGRLSTDELYQFVLAYDGPVNQIDTQIQVAIDEVRDISCAGFNDGAVSISVEGPGLQHFFAWNNGDTTEDLTGLSAGIYRVTVTDNLQNRHIVNPLTLTQPDTLMLLFLQNTPSSETATDGSVIANVSGGTPPYAYIWNNGATTFNNEDIGQGTYSVQVIDANGCQISDSIALIVPDCGLQVAINVQPTSCDENPDGQINLLVEGAVAPITFAWSHGADTRNVGGLASGGYEVTVTDALGCTEIAGEVVTIDDREPPIARIRGPLTFYLPASGEIEISPEQIDSNSFDNCGILDMQIGQSVFTCNDLGRNFVEFTVIDNNLNITSRDAEITILDTLQPFWECTEDISVTACDGIVNYPVPRIVDNCSNGSVISLAGRGSGAEFPLGTSTETYTYMSGNGQRVECSIEITVERRIAADINVRDVTCPGANDGAASVSLDSPGGNYRYNWSDGQTTASAVNLAAGDYRVTVSDSSECTFIKTVFVGEPVNLSVRVDSIKAVEGRGNLFITPLGGTPPYRYQWLLGNESVSTLQDPQNLEFGLYSLLLTDARGCQLGDFTVQVDLSTNVEESNSLNALELGPNPNQGKFNLDFSGLDFTARDVSIKILSLAGQILFEKWVPLADRIYVDATDVPSGMHLIQIAVGSNQTTRRLVIYRR